MSNAKKIAVIVRNRQAEALRVSGGLTLADDSVEIFILDRKLDLGNPAITAPLELVKDLELNIYSNNPDNNATTLTLDEMAKKLLDYDIVVPY